MVPLTAYTLQLWFKFFLLTQLVEVPIYLFQLPQHWKRRHLWFVACGASMLTHPIVWFGFPWLSAELLWVYVGSECFAIGVEACFLRMMGVRWRNAWILSCMANAASMVVGEGLQSATTWVVRLL